MAYQFAHLETYSRKANKDGVSTRFVFDEATRREPSACLHVDSPQKPDLVYGMSVEDLEKLHDARCADARTTDKTGKEKSIRSDQKTLATVILSYPEVSDEGMASYDEWEKRCVDWLKSKYGDEFKCAVRHTDELHPHIHAYILPDAQNMKASGFHPGYAAKQKAKAEAKADGQDAKIANKIADRAYKESMRAWQDDFYEHVGLPCGMTRIGPKRQRKTRAAHNEDKAEAARKRQDALRREKLEKDREQLRRDQVKLAKDREIIEESAGGGWFQKRRDAKALASLKASDEVQKDLDDAFKKGAESKRPAFEKLKKVATDARDNLATENVSLRKGNVELAQENREFSTERQTYEIRMAQAELVAQDTIEGLREVAYETSLATAYRHLSAACEKVHETHEADNSVFRSVIQDVRRICGEVKQHVPAVFCRFFRWTPEEQQRQAEKIVQFQPKPEPAPQARSVLRSSPTFGL